MRAIFDFCEKKGFPPSELIEKYEELDQSNDDLLKINNEQSSELTIFRRESQNKPQISPETGLPVNPSKSQNKAKDEAENKPAELSPFLKSRQALKNGQNK